MIKRLGGKIPGDTTGHEQSRRGKKADFHMMRGMVWYSASDMGCACLGGAWDARTFFFFRSISRANHPDPSEETSRVTLLGQAGARYFVQQWALPRSYCSPTDSLPPEKSNCLILSASPRGIWTPHLILQWTGAIERNLPLGFRRLQAGRSLQVAGRADR